LSLPTALQDHDPELARYLALEELRAYRMGEACEEDDEVQHRGKAFVEGCETLLSKLRVLPRDTPVRSGTFVHMPYLPLGRFRMCRVPLVDGTWIDRTVIELCEACAHLHDKGFSRLPPRDYHHLAWHRFYPRGTYWASPKAAGPDTLEEARREAWSRLGRLRTRTREIDGRPFIHFEDYWKWNGRKVPGDLSAPHLRQDGLEVCSWNSWIHGLSEDGRVNHYGYMVTRIEHPCPARPGRDFCAYEDPCKAKEALRERTQALATVAKLLMYVPEAEGRTPLQRQVLGALDGRALTKEALANYLNCDPVTLYRPGGIKELMEAGRVQNSRIVGGYYRPDRPPPAQNPLGK
jgi:hypothetical protein